MSKDKDCQEPKASEQEQLLESLQHVIRESGEFTQASEVTEMKRCDEEHNSAKSEPTKILAFKCPECGGNRLQWDRHAPYYRSGIVRAIEVDAEGNSDCVEGCYIGMEPCFCLEDLTTEYGSTWSCIHCNHVITDEEGHPIEWEESLVEWMLLHGEVVEDLSELKGSADEIGRRCM